MRRNGRLALAVVLTAIGGCLGVDTPAGGVAAIGRVTPPSPSVVRGDVMRDSTGAPAPLRVALFNADGDTISGETSFLVLDRGLHLDADNIAQGDSVVPGGVRVVALSGSLQSAIARIPVTLAPVTVTAASGQTTVIAYDPFSTDTTATANTLSLGVAARAAGDTASVGFIVDFAVFRAPAARDTAAVAYLRADATRLYPRDTTDASGNASRTLVFRPNRLADSTAAQLAAGGVDTIGVRGTLHYAGTSTPVDFLIEVRKKP